ncbi:thiamine phosphate synthase [Flavobacterium cerinum]|uniref:Thiamine-phosphate synthase n=1 Tax=Flavobacterium cerinum TaxID=2502784 RepID=A0ABY5IUX9_9FLAO|nr:thiamine phosphate synthase [Flavobacterium cerinum]UUC46632.1 thiamine phosphate synthase [Flavobacterium cerinum]
MHNKLQYISQGNTLNEQLFHIESVLHNGGKWIQVRFKNGTEKERYLLAESAKKSCKKHNATLIINDDVALAKEINADGVHLGLDDMAISKARLILGKEKIIGGTANTLQDVFQRYHEKCDYIGLGPFRFTDTKQQLSPILGHNGYFTIMQLLNDLDYTIPVYAIGGITLNDIDSLLETGIHGIAVSGMITNNSNQKQLLTQLNQKLYESS